MINIFVTVLFFFFLIVPCSHANFVFVPSISINTYSPLQYYGRNYYRCYDNPASYSYLLGIGECEFHNWGIGNTSYSADLIPLFDAVLPNPCWSEGAFYTIQNDFWGFNRTNSPYGSFGWSGDNPPVLIDFTFSYEFNQQIATYTIPPPPSAPPFADGVFDLSVVGDKNSGTISYNLKSPVDGVSLWGSSVNVFKNGSLISSSSGSISYGGVSGIDLRCNNYDFVYSGYPLSECHTLSGGTYSYTALEYKLEASFSRGVYSVDVSGLSLSNRNNYEIAFVGSIYYGEGVDSQGSGFALGDSTGSNTALFSSLDNVTSFDIDVYDSSWSFVGTVTVPVILLGSSPEPITWGYYVYDLQSNYITELPFGGSAVLEFPFIDKGAITTFNIEYCGDYTCATVPIVGNRVSSCDSSLVGAWRYDDLGNPVVVPYTFVNNIYDFTDYNNHSGVVNLDLLDCHSLPVTQVLNGSIPVCSVKGTGGEGGGRKGIDSRQRIIQHTIKGAYERKIIP